MKDLFRGVPEAFKTKGVFVKGRVRVLPGDEVEAIGDVRGLVAKGTRVVVAEILVEPSGEGRGAGFDKSISFVGYEKEGGFNPSKFRKVA